MRSLVGTALIPGVLLSAAPAALAAPCDTGEILATFPEDGAMDVPTNAHLFARYAAATVYASEPIVLTPTAPAGVPGTFDSAERLLRLDPPEPLPPGAYSLKWPGLLGGGGSGARGRAEMITFTVGARSDEASPAFVGIGELDWNWRRRNDPCTDDLEDRYVFDFVPGAADDDGGRASLALLVYQTQGPTLTAPRLLSISRIPAPNAHVEVALTPAEGLGHVCFTALVRDLTGRTSAASPEPCVDTTTVPYFVGCSVASRDIGDLGGGFAIGLALLCLLLVRATGRRS